MTAASAMLLSSICFIAMASPGPDFILVTRNSVTYPRKQALATAFGVVSGCIIHASYCIMGLALLITRSIVLFSAIKYAGACYLIYLGFRGLTWRPGMHAPVQRMASRELSVSGAFMQGFLCNVLNPKLAIFLLSLFTQFISADASIADKCAVAVIFVAEALLYWPLLALILQSAVVRRTFEDSRVYLERACGAVLLTLGMRIALSRD